MKPDAREVALGMLLARENPSRAVSYDLLESPRDRALAMELVNGVIRWQRLLQSYVSAFSNRPLKELSPDLRNALLLGAFQLLLLGTAPHAAVDSVVRHLRGKGERSYCNACLRSISRNLGHVSLPDLGTDPVRYMAERYSYPDWIPAYFAKRAGVPWALAMCRNGNVVPPVTLRVDVTKISRDDLLRRFLDAGYEAEKGRLAISLRVRRGRSVRDFPGYSEGLFAVQDEGAMVISLALDPREGHTVWDVCAAPGGKTAHLSGLVGQGGRVLATDIDENRASMIEENAQRMRLSNVDVQVMDATVKGPEGSFDRVLLDAPCSGLGVLNRNPDLRWNRRRSDIDSMAKRQKLLLDKVSSKVKPGGVLVYSTCTVTAEENESVWEGFLGDHPEFSPEDPSSCLGGHLMVRQRLFQGPGYRYLLPDKSGTDGFFVARARRR